jgi:hypothetical protein
MPALSALELKVFGFMGSYSITLGVFQFVASLETITHPWHGFSAVRAITF